MNAAAQGRSIQIRDAKKAITRCTVNLEGEFTVTSDRQSGTRPPEVNGGQRRSTWMPGMVET